MTNKPAKKKVNRATPPVPYGKLHVAERPRRDAIDVTQWPVEKCAAIEEIQAELRDNSAVRKSISERLGVISREINAESRPGIKRQGELALEYFQLSKDRDQLNEEAKDLGKLFDWHLSNPHQMEMGEEEPAQEAA